jgi:signal transduction histidine kinase
MTRSTRLAAAPPDPRGRLISIFVGAVLLPSVALSVVLFYLIPRHAETTKIALYKRAERTLAYIEKDLEQAAHAKALEAARVLGPERLLEARPAEIRARLKQAGFGDPVFDSLHLEVSSKRSIPGWGPEHDAELQALREALAFNGGLPPPEYDDWVDLPPGEFEVPGTLHFQYACSYAHGTLLAHYFEKEFMNPGGSMVIRVSEPGGKVVYETAPTPGGEFEVKRHMTSPSFRGLSLSLRYRERSIAEDVHRWKMGTMTLIGFIDLMLGAGLFMVYSNVRREIHLSRLKSDFVANVSHELKTPLALIRLFAETLELGRVASPEKTTQYYRVISKESLRLTQLINNILDFSRIEAGRKEYKFAPADIPSIVDEVIDTYRFQIEQQGFELDLKVSRDLPEVAVDKEALSQALINLVNNAIKFSTEEKYLGLEVRQDGNRLLITVRDRGIGVAKGEVKRIFDKFYRAEDSLVHETKGSGLGLSLVRHIMEAHGGEVQVESAPGRGSTFTLVLPLSRGQS